MKMFSLVALSSFAAVFLLGCAVETGTQETKSPPRELLKKKKFCGMWTVELDTRFPESWREPMIAALDAWSSALGESFQYSLVLTDKVQPYAKPVGCVLSIEAATSLIDGEDAGLTDRTLFNETTGEKFGHLAIMIADKVPGGVHALTLHELGHFFGLGHSTSKDSVMHVPLPIPATPTPEDVRNVRAAWIPLS